MKQQGISILKQRAKQIENKSKPSQREYMEQRIQQRMKNGPQTELENQVLSIKDRKREG